MLKSKWSFSALLFLLFAGAAHANVYITEWMYNGKPSSNIGEYIEFTNTGPDPVDMTGWSFDDSSNLIGSQSLSGFGMLAVGESALLTDDTAANFRTNWHLADTVKVIGGNSNNLSRSDALYLYNPTSEVDHIIFDDQTIGGPRANAVGANVLSPNYGAHRADLAVLSVVGDGFGSTLSNAGEIGSPGQVPEPSLGLLAGAGLLLLRRRRAI